MSKHLGLALFALPFLAACGGSTASTKSASSVSAQPSHLSIDAAMQGDEPYEVTGPAFAQYTPGVKLLMIYVVDPSSQPAPSCASIGPAGMQSFKSGGMASVGFKNPSGAAETGAFPVMQSGYMRGDIAKQELHTGGSVPDDSQLVISAYDANHLEAEVKAPDGKTRGTLHAQVCPDDTQSAKMQQQMQSAMAAMPPPPPPSAAGETAFTVQLGNSLNDVAGAKALVKLDPKTKILGVVAWPADMITPTTCDTFTAKRGTTEDTQNSFLWAKNVSAKPGKYSLYAVGETFVESNGTKAVLAAHDGTINVTKFDDKSFTADLVTTSKLALTGKIVADVCPAGHFDAPTDDQLFKPANYSGKAGGKKKK